MKTWKDNIYFVLVEPREAGNIGASARALKNMGFRNLCLVNPPAVLTDEARWLARHALDILESAKTFETLEDALADKSLVVGTTRRTGKRRGPTIHAEEAVGNLVSNAAKNKIAIIFGREDRGLYNKEVSRCGFLLTIPSNRSQPSLNLSQAVLIISYELSKAGHSFSEKKRSLRKGSCGSVYPVPLASSAELVPQKELLSLYTRIDSTLKALGYIPRGNRDLEAKIMLNLKYFIGRAGLTRWELNMLHGICSQIEKKIAGSDKVVPRK